MLCRQDALKALDLICNPHDQLYLGMHRATAGGAIAAGLDLILNLIGFWNVITDNLIPRDILLFNKMLNLIIQIKRDMIILSV